MLLHFVGMVADPAACLVVELTVVPYDLQVVHELLHEAILVFLQLGLHSAKVHRMLHDLVVVRQG